MVQNSRIQVMKEKVLEGSWIIDAPLEDVYKIISDFEKSPEYFPLVAKGMKVVSKDGNNLKIEAVTNNNKKDGSNRLNCYICGGVFLTRLALL